MFRILTLIALLNFTFSYTQESSSLIIKNIPLDSTVMVDTLSNGLTYYIKENKEPQQNAELYLVIKTGSLQETEAQQGLAHFLEHMAFNGTKSFPKNELIDYLQAAGIRFGADLNAYTTFDQTVYQLPLPTDKNEVFETGFKILSEWAGAITLNGDDIDSERGIIVEENRQRGKNVSGRMTQKLLPVLLANSKYADRIPIGKMEIIDNFEHDTLRAYYETWYQPQLQAVIAVGDFDKDMVEDYIKKHFGELNRPKNTKTPEKYIIPGNETPLVEIATDPEYPYTVATILYKHQSNVTKTTLDFRNSIIRSAINSLLAARIRESIENGDAPYLQASANYGPYQGGIGNLDAFTLQLVAKNILELRPGLEGLMDEINSMVQFGFTQSEWERVKLNFMNSVNKSYNEKDHISSKVFVNQYLKHFLYGEAYMDMEYSYSFYEKHLETITIEELNNMAKSWVSNKNQIIMLQASEKEKENLPNKTELESWVNNNSRSLEAYSEEDLDEPLLDKHLPGSSVVSIKKLNSIKATEYRLENGIKIILKPTDFKNDEILFSGFSPGGVSLAERNNLPSSKLADNIIASSGAGKFSPVQLNKMLSGKTLGVSPYINLYSEGVKGFTSNNDLETSLKLIYLYLMEPRKDSTIFNTIRENYSISITNKSDNPMAVFQDSVNIAMKGRSPWASSMDLMDLDQVDLDKAMAFYRERFKDFSDFTFVFVGSFDNDKIIDPLVKYLGSLPAIHRKESYQNHDIRPLSGNYTNTVYGGIEDKATVVLAYHNQYKYSSETNIILDALNTILEDKLVKRLREKESGVYSPSVNISYVKIPQPYYSLSISFNCATDRVDELVSATEEEINSIMENGINQEDLDKFISQMTRQHQLKIRKNNFWLNYIRGVYTLNTDITDINNFEKKIKRLSISEINKAAKKYFSTPNQIKLVLLPKKENQIQESK